MTSIKIKENSIKSIVMIIALICIFEPLYFTKTTSIHFLAQSVSIFSCVFITFKVIRSHFKISKLSKVTIAYCSVIFITSILNGGIELSTIRVLLGIVQLTLYFEYYDFEFMRKVTLDTFFVLLVVNIILFECMNQSVSAIVGVGNWFLTGPNALLSYCFPAILVALTSIDIKKQYALSIMVIILSLFTAFLSETATTEFVLVVLLILWIFEKITKLQIINIKKGIIILFALFVLLVVFQVQDNVFFVKYIVVELLQRDITFTSRTFIWTESINQFLQSPIIGYGYGYSFHVNVNGSGFYADHAHNHYLQQLVQGGILQFALFLEMLYLSIKNMQGSKKKYAVACTVSFIMLGLMFMVESYLNAMVYLFIIYINAYSVKIKVLHGICGKH